jgi:hypothetical protein
MKITFVESIEKSATEFYLLRQRAENETVFDKAVEWMTKNSFVCDMIFLEALCWLNMQECLEENNNATQQ